MDCEIVVICKGVDIEAPEGYERIGSIFLVYFYGLPDIEKYNNRVESIYLDYIHNVHDTDTNYNTRDGCIACGICPSDGAPGGSESLMSGSQ